MSRISLLVLLLFGITVIGLAFIGILHIFNQDSLTRELTSLQKSNILLQNVLSDVEYSSILDSSGSYEEFISDFYSKHQISYPDAAPVNGYVTRGLNLETNHYGIDIAAKFQDEIQKRVHERLRGSGPKALSVVEELMVSADSETVRLGAAKDMLDRGGFKVYQDEEMGKTVEEMEQQLVALVGKDGAKLLVHSLRTRKQISGPEITGE